MQLNGSILPVETLMKPTRTQCMTGMDTIFRGEECPALRSIEDLAAENEDLKKRIEAFEATERRKTKEHEQCKKKESKEYAIYCKYRAIISEDTAKSINFPHTSSREKIARYGWIKISGRGVFCGRSECSFDKGEYPRSWERVTESGLTISKNEAARWAEKFNLCPQCGTIDEHGWSEEFSLFKDKLERENRPVVEAWDWDYYELDDQSVLDFGSMWELSSRIAFTHDIEKCGRCRGVKNNTYKERLSEFAASHKDFWCFENELRSHSPSHWHAREWERDAPKREEAMRIFREKDDALRASIKWGADRREAKKRATSIKNRNKSKLNNKKLKFITRIGMASKLNQTCKQ